VLSHVLPFPESAGQRQRVFYTLKAARKLFHVTFATFVARGDEEQVKSKLLEVCDDVILLPSIYQNGRRSKAWHQSLGALYSLGTGLKFSNYILGKVELSPARVSRIAQSNFDCVLFEYWHASDSASTFREKGIPCVLDMHDILWQAHGRNLNGKSFMPAWWKRLSLRQYKAREEAAWLNFDGLIAINREEMNYLTSTVPEPPKIFYAPMGTDLTLWSYSWEPATPVRVAYYGGMSSHHNQQDALRCFKYIMPRIWARYPTAEFWMVGSNPPQFLKELASDPRVTVTGFVEDVQSVLRSMSVVVCPWRGTYGFRSRLIEVMALGVPLVASGDAVWGMDLRDEHGLLLAIDDDSMANQTLRLLDDEEFAAAQSRLARQQVERLYGLDCTYEKLAHDLSKWLCEQTKSRNSQDNNSYYTDR
jgi:glycosyltransferase involved in cell wall biosynthesis